MNCKRCGHYIGEYSGKGRPKQYCDNCLPLDNRPRSVKTLGTTDIEAKMSRDKDGEPNFDKEVNVIRKEMRKLGLRK